ncbi:MAG: hypothetical protein KF774_02905 [Planctomyces sp.]|nr:hypothetical protein [Planctomyces sp.]
MPTADQEARLRGMTFVLQVITLALVLGVSLFTGYTVLLAGALRKQPEGTTMSIVGVGMAISAIICQYVAFAVCDAAAVRNARGNPNAEIGPIYFLRTLISLAFLESAAFMNAIALLQEHNAWSLAIIGVVLVLMLLRLPTRTRVEQWLEARRMDASASAADRDEDWPRGNDDFGDRPNA